MKKALNFTAIYKKYPGKWVALSNDEKTVLGAGKTAKEAIQISQKGGNAHPILHRVPTKIHLFV